MVSIFNADLVKDHFIITDNGKRALIDTGCPFVINDGNKQSKPMGELYLNDARRNVDPTIAEFRGLEYFAQRKVLFDYRKAVVVIADQSDEVDPVHPVAEFPISGLPQRIVFSAVVGGKKRELIFDSGASIANYLTESIARTGTPCGTTEDFHPQLGKYAVNPSRTAADSASHAPLSGANRSLSVTCFPVSMSYTRVSKGENRCAR